jgi:hypothetical protein
MTALLPQAGTWNLEDPRRLVLSLVLVSRHDMGGIASVRLPDLEPGLEFNPLLDTENDIDTNTNTSTDNDTLIIKVDVSVFRLTTYMQDLPRCYPDRPLTRQIPYSLVMQGNINLGVDLMAEADTWTLNKLPCQLTDSNRYQSPSAS